ncbi:hypothetical protein ACTXOJ_11555 [Glutamicibacter arilaitensis]|uniref:hypothetical protein n=1 Tax=Glutamicibacter arilaitensis TaxID=256701 RepID=UPI003FD135F8
MKKFAPLILVAGLALTGCAPKALEVAPGPSHVPAGAPVAVAVAEPTKAPISAGQAWADDMMTQYLNGRGAHSFDAFNGQAMGAVTSWSSPKEGYLVINIGGSGWTWDNDLLGIAQEFMAYVGYDSKDLESVKVVAPESGASGSYGREDMGNATPWG